MEARIKIALSVVVFVLLIIAFSLVYSYFQRLNRPVWMFKGAYAVYEYQGFVWFIPYKVSFRFEVTKVEYPLVTIVVHCSFESGLKNDEKTYVVSLKCDDHFWENIIERIDGKPSKHYIKFVYVEGHGIRECIVYEVYKKDAKTIYYIDKKNNWLMRIDYISKDIKIVLKIKETNINFKD